MHIVKKPMKKILYVDDAKSMRRLVEMVLSKFYDITLATDGLEGLKALAKQDYDVIVSDINMPNMNGLDFLQTLRENPDHRYTPVLMMTTEADEEMKAKGKELGATGWITKPFDPEKLIKVLERVSG